MATPLATPSHLMGLARLKDKTSSASTAVKGCEAGFANEITAKVSEMVAIPVIASGGAGTKEHFVEVFEKGRADAALAASIFHYNEIPVPELKEYLKKKNITIR